ncbi:MAG: ATP-binding protein [Verrucomicrobiota bacterium]
MSQTDRRRISAAEVILLLLVGLIGWAAWRTYGIVAEINRAPIALDRVEREYLDIADHVQAFVDDAHDAVAKFVTTSERAEWERYQRRSRAFTAWLEERQQYVIQGKIVMIWPIGLTVDFNSLLANLHDAADGYSRAVTPLTQPNLPLLRAVEIEEEAEVKAERLEQLGMRARAQANGIHLFLEGSRRWLVWLQRLMLASVLTLTAAGLWLALVIYRRVVTPLRARLVETQAVLERQQKLVHFGELAAVVAHEIRNPLSAITTRLFTLQRSLTKGSREDTDATVIRNEIHRLDRIVKDFLESAQPSSPVLAPLTAPQIFAEVQHLLAPTCEKNAIELTVDGTTPAPFLADAQQLTQVLINLIQNAAESIGQAGTITLRARTDNRRLHERPATVVLLEVEDSGPGIAPNIQRRLFDPFFSTKKGGTGLGLSIAARIVNRHCGVIDLQSQPGRTIFTIILPVHEAQP